MPSPFLSNLVVLMSKSFANSPNAMVPPGRTSGLLNLSTKSDAALSNKSFGMRSKIEESWDNSQEIACCIASLTAASNSANLLTTFDMREGSELKDTIALPSKANARTLLIAADSSGGGDSCDKTRLSDAMFIVGPSEASLPCMYGGRGVALGSIIVLWSQKPISGFAA